VALAALWLCGNVAGKRWVGRLDSDGDGAISGEEVQESGFFSSLDGDRDGTLSGAELLRVAEEVGIGDVERGVNGALDRVDLDAVRGIQGDDLAVHWRRLTSLATPEEVADWVRHALLMPQYAEKFKANSIKGYDLPLILEDPDHLAEIGVTSKLHAKLILRSITMRLLGLGHIPGKPEINCTVSNEDGEVAVVSWGETAENEQESKSLPIHRWRVFVRHSNKDPWSFLQDYGASDRGDKIRLQMDGFLEVRIEAWNPIGRSDYAYADCKSTSLSKDLETCDSPDVEKLQLMKNTKERSKFAPNFFSSADKDGDGDIDSEELQLLLHDLDEPLCASGAPQGLTAHIEKQREFLNKKGASVGMRHIDGNKDDTIYPTELESHWQGMQRLMTVSRTIDWLVHAVELPQYAKAFKEKSITGFDLPGLIDNDGAKLEKLIGPENQMDKHLIVRAVTVLFMGVGSPPSTAIHADVRPGDQCGRITVDWSVSINSRRHRGSLLQDEMPIHKYRVLRRRVDGERWAEVYSGMSTAIEDMDLSRNFAYVYRVEAWNLLGVSPVYESRAIMANTEDCKTTLQVIGTAIFVIFSIPYAFLNVVIDNYYRITAGISFVGFLAMSNNVPAREKKRAVKAMKDRICSLLKATFGTAFALEHVFDFLIAYFDRRRNDEDSRSVGKGRSRDRGGDENDSPVSPHQDMVSRAVEATFPGKSLHYHHHHHRRNQQRNAPMHSKSEPARSLKQSKSLGPPSSLFRSWFSNSTEEVPQVPAENIVQDDEPFAIGPNSKWKIVKRHVNVRRAANAFAACNLGEGDDFVETDASSESAADAVEGKGNSENNPKTTSKSRFIKLPLRLAKKKKSKSGTDVDADSTSSPRKVNHVHSHSSGRSHQEMFEVSIRNCSCCHKKVTSRNRHTCGSCHHVYCNDCTAYKPHSWIKPCNIDSKCRCKHCYFDL